MPILSGLIVSIDAFFIGIPLGLEKKCKFIYLGIINIFLFALCILGFFAAHSLYEKIPFETGIIVGFSFIALGAWYIFFNYFIKREKKNNSLGTIVIAGLVMSLEAMVITMGIAFIFLPDSTVVIPITVALAHFGYSALSFALARSKYVRRVPARLSHIISGAALIAYGLMALFF